jgi:hypothetical protein
MITVGAATLRNRGHRHLLGTSGETLGGVLAGFTQVNIGRLFVALAGISHTWKGDSVRGIVAILV